MPWRPPLSAVARLSGCAPGERHSGALADAVVGFAPVSRRCHQVVGHLRRASEAT